MSHSQVRVVLEFFVHISASIFHLRGYRCILEGIEDHPVSDVL